MSRKHRSNQLPKEETENLNVALKIKRQNKQFKYIITRHLDFKKTILLKLFS